MGGLPGVDGSVRTTPSDFPSVDSADPVFAFFEGGSASSSPLSVLTSRFKPESQGGLLEAASPLTATGSASDWARSSFITSLIMPSDLYLLWTRPPLALGLLQ